MFPTLTIQWTWTSSLRYHHFSFVYIAHILWKGRSKLNKFKSSFFKRRLPQKGKLDQVREKKDEVDWPFLERTGGLDVAQGATRQIGGLGRAALELGQPVEGRALFDEDLLGQQLVLQTVQLVHIAESVLQATTQRLWYPVLATLSFSNHSPLLQTAQRSVATSENYLRGRRPRRGPIGRRSPSYCSWQLHNDFDRWAPAFYCFPQCHNLLSCCWVHSCAGVSNIYRTECSDETWPFVNVRLKLLRLPLNGFI